MIPVLLAAVALAACHALPVRKKDNYDATPPEEVTAAQAANGSIFQSGHDVPLFENAVAHYVGDTVTINLVEATAAQKSSSTNTAKKTTIGVTAPQLGHNTFGGLSASAGANNAFGGSGDSAQSNKLQGDITVTIAKRLANGNLLVRGQKWIMINQGKEFVRIQGVIRPIDIQPDNTIPSNKVADATISYGGQGSVADANAPGLLSRFFNSPWSPF